MRASGTLVRVETWVDSRDERRVITFGTEESAAPLDSSACDRLFKYSTSRVSLSEKFTVDVARSVRLRLSAPIVAGAERAGGGRGGEGRGGQKYVSLREFWQKD